MREWIPDLAKCAAVLIGITATCVLTGWLLGVEAMVRVLPDSAAMSINTAILFVAASIRLWPAARGASRSPLRVVATAVLIVLPCVILFEHWIDYDLGIDRAALHRTVVDGNPRPGRTAPNAIAGFLLAALFFLILDYGPTRRSRTLQAIAAFCIYGTLLIGVTALAGFFLDLEMLYRLEAFNRVAAPTAMSLIVLGIGMQMRLLQASWQRSEDTQATLNGIVRTSAVVLTFVAIVTGLSGFAVLKSSYDATRSDAALETTRYVVSVLTDLLDEQFIGTARVANDRALRDALSRAGRDPSNAATVQTLHAVGDGLIAAGFSRVGFFDDAGDTIVSTGSGTEPASVLAVPMSLGPIRGTLLWDGGFVLRTEATVTDQGRTVGRVVVTRALKAMTMVVQNMQRDNASTDVLVCTREADDAVCFPSRFYPNLRIPLVVDGQPNLAISRALIGQQGVMSVEDVRGKNVVAAYQPLTRYGLGLVVKMDRVDLYGPIRQRLNLLAALLALVIAGGTLVLYVSLRPLARRLMSDHLAVKEGEERLRVTLRSIGDAVITSDVEGRVSFLNPVAERMTGWRNEEASGRPLDEVFRIIHAETGEPAPNPLEAVLETRVVGSLGQETVLLQRGGGRFLIEDSAAPIINPHGKLFGGVLVFHDVTQARAMAAEMTRQATHDPLTGLINRREFERRLLAALQPAQSDGGEHSMLYLDLDQFKVVNDRCGHGAGDELLRQLTSLLHDRLRRGDTLSRLGGDEFGVLLQGCSAVPAQRIAETLRQTVSDFRFAWDDKVFALGVSVGLVTFSDGDLTLTDVLRMADAACYVAKDKGRNRVHVYAADDEELALRSGQMGWIGKLRKALDEDRFVLFSQRIVALGDASDDANHFELLLRLRDEAGDYVSPMAFIPAAERYGLMPMLDRWVISTAFAHYGALQKQGKHGICAINLSANSICDETFASFIQEAFARHDVPPRGICFEITETAAVTNLKQATLFINTLKTMGCRFALDDFGSGMSSFGHLKHLPVDFLKIDGEFVKDMADDPIDRAMVRSIHEIGHVMGLKTIAEFVESDAILAELRRIGVDYAQGYGIEKPRPAW